MRIQTKISLAIILTIFLLISGCGNDQKDVIDVGGDNVMVIEPEPEDEEEEDEQVSEDILEVHFIDVGDGEAILIIMPNERSMLIDCGDNKHTKQLTSYIKSQVEKIDVLVATHPDVEHIGGCDEVMQNIDVERVYDSGIRPQYESQTYWDYFYEANEKDHIIVEGDTDITLDRNVGIKLIVPYDTGGPQNDPNDNSVLTRVTYGDTAFLFTADCSVWCEKNITNANLGAGVLKVSDSGNSGFTTQEFLNRVNPEIAVISVSPENRYGYPEWGFLDRFSNINVYRTDSQGNIIINSNGKDYGVKLEKE